MSSSRNQTPCPLGNARRAPTISSVSEANGASVLQRSSRRSLRGTLAKYRPKTDTTTSCLMPLAWDLGHIFIGENGTALRILESLHCTRFFLSSQIVVLPAFTSSCQKQCDKPCHFGGGKTEAASFFVELTNGACREKRERVA